MVEEYCHNYIKIEDKLYIRMVECIRTPLWAAESSGQLTRRMTDDMMFGQSKLQKIF